MSATIPLPRAAGRLTIDLDAIAWNYNHLKALSAPATVAAVVKANGYGLGALPIMRRLLKEGCRDFYVAHAGEALELRAAFGPGPKLRVLNGFAGIAPADFVAAGLTPVLNNRSDLALWAGHAARLDVPLACELHVDTGMNRLGFTAADLGRIAAEPALAAGLKIELLMSHLACAEEAANPMNAAQLAAFRSAAAHFPGVKLSLANSQGIHLGRAYHFDRVRPGAGLYGLNPFLDRPNPMRAAVKLEALILDVRAIDRGESVGYGATFRAGGPMRIAILGAGYADGIPRSLSNRGEVAFAGATAPIAGRISMDLMAADVTHLPESAVKAGDWAELIGPNLPADAVAAAAGSAGYEVLTRLGQRYERRYLGAGED